MDELTTKYYRAKWDFYVREKLQQMKVSSRELEETANYHGGKDGKDAMIRRRAEFMYNYFDYDNDRARVRNRFIEAAHKRTTLKDIGESLDKFLLDERAEGLRYMDMNKDDSKVPSASKDTSSFEMTWTGRLFKDTDPLKPLLLDHDTPLDSMAEDLDTPYRDILNRIKYEDSRTDYSPNSLSAE